MSMYVKAISHQSFRHHIFRIADDCEVDSDGFALTALTEHLLIGKRICQLQNAEDKLKAKNEGYGSGCALTLTSFRRGTEH